MWPVITAMAGSYAPQIVLPAAMVAGFIGEIINWRKNGNARFFLQMVQDEFLFSCREIRDV